MMNKKHLKSFIQKIICQFDENSKQKIRAKTASAYKMAWNC